MVYNIRLGYVPDCCNPDRFVYGDMSCNYNGVLLEGTARRNHYISHVAWWCSIGVRNALAEKLNLRYGIETHGKFD